MFPFMDKLARQGEKSIGEMFQVRSIKDQAWIIMDKNIM